MENVEEYKPLFATIDGVKKGPFSANELSEIFKKGGFGSIWLSNNQAAIDKQTPTIANTEFYTKNSLEKEIATNLVEKGWTLDEIAKAYTMTTAEVELLLETKE